MARGCTRMVCVGFTNSNYFILPELISEKQVKSSVALTEEVKKKERGRADSWETFGVS